jgi:hypothetical protein
VKAGFLVTAPSPRNGKTEKEPDMDQQQGTIQVPRRVASGYFSLIFFIVLSLVLIAGYVPVLTDYLSKRRDLEALDANVKTKILDPLRNKNVPPLPQEQAKDGVTLLYGAPFFTELGKLAEKGADYSALVSKVGVRDPNNALKEVEDRLQTAKKSSLTEFVDDLQKELGMEQQKVKAADEARGQAIKDRDAALDTKAKTEMAFQNTIKKVENERDEWVAQARKNEQGYKDKLDEVNNNWLKESKNIAEERKQMAMTLDGAKRKETKLGQEITDLREALVRKAPPPPPGPVANVMRVDLFSKLVVLDRGGSVVKQGTELLVYRQVGQGKKQLIGKIYVIRVGEITSTADIVTLDDKNPIVAGDMAFLLPQEAQGSGAAPATGKEAGK